MFKSLTDPINELRAIRLSRKGAKAAQAGDIDACEKLYRRGFAIMERTFGNVEATAAYTVTLGGLLQSQGRLEEAVPFYERTLAILEKALGPEHPDVATSLENSATLLRETERTDEAEELETRAKAIRAKHAGGLGGGRR
jgi:tetratricopeptide (TPR) repeat protein